MPTRQWTDEEKALIIWFLDYINTRTLTRNDQFYDHLIDEIVLGPDSPRSRSGALINGLRLMKTLVEQYNKKKADK